MDKTLELKRISILVDKSLHRRIKMSALKADLSMKDYILKLIEHQSYPDD